MRVCHRSPSRTARAEAAPKARRDRVKKTGGRSSYVCVSPFGERTQARPQNMAMKIRPMIGAQLVRRCDHYRKVYACHEIVKLRNVMPSILTIDASILSTLLYGLIPERLEAASCHIRFRLRFEMASTSTSLTIATLPRLTPTALHALLTSSPASATSAASPSPTQSVAVIDVRDSDHIGGHIRTSQHHPTSTLDYRMPELVRTLKDTDTVVFHCMLSQQRGPSAALRYVRERERLLGEDARGQKVCVLEGGFQAWVGRYGRDEGVTEGYRAEIWEDEED
ncbi:hypothetical protein MRB53_041613 [Persea americana]|nr:hypothetical protein MRB53_041613 [Persea americana]